jgi:hypothetical protein
MNVGRSLGVLVVAMLSLAPGCGSLVGADCRAGLTRCNHLCIDLQTDPENCGACGNVCAHGTTCALGVCSTPFDAGPRDAGTDGGRGDAGDASNDTGLDAGSVDANRPDTQTDVGTDDANIDAAIDGGGADAGPTCGLGELLCGTACVDPNDPAHCGDCTTMCGVTQVCAAGSCTTTCAPLTDCGTFCADLTNDPDHCGSCTMSCGSGICVAGTCQAALAGHLVLIGHDFEMRRMPMSQILANAVLLPGRASVRLLVWEGSVTAASRTGTYAGIMQGAGGRGHVATVATTAASVPVLLDSSDSFLVMAQAGSTNAELTMLGAMWSTALDQFLARGGVVVVLEAPTATNDGTYQILSAAGLFAATARTEIVLPVLNTISGRAGDPVLLGVPLSYRGETHTCFYATTDPDAIVGSTSGPVVFDRTVTP